MARFSILPHPTRRVRATAGTRARKPLSREQVRHVSDLINRSKETNYTQEAGTANNVYTTAQFWHLTDNIIQGDGQGQRVGDEIDLRYVRLSCDLATKSTAAATTLNDIRFIVFKWLEDDADLTPTVGAILEDTTTLPIHSPYVHDKASRSKFRVLYDTHFTLCDRSNGATRSFRDYLLKFGPKKLGKLSFNEGAVTGKGHIFMMFLGNQASGNDNALMNYSFQVLYKDM